VSLSDITQLLGTGSVPVLVAVTVFGVFELGEKLASQRAKDALSNWLTTFDVRKAGALPVGTLESFERIFGKRHFSLKCFIRSVVFSLSAMIFIGVLIFLLYPQVALKIGDELFDYSYGLWLAFALWLPWSILIDYFSLFKTRVILRVLARIRSKITIIAIAILTIDVIVYKLLFVVGLVVVALAAVLVNLTVGFVDYARDEGDPIKILIATILHVPQVGDRLGFIMFWAGFAPSLWMWLYVLALFVTRALFRSEPIVNWLRWCLDIEKAPLRSIGAVAAALAFIATVAILLISAEISRLSGAAYTPHHPALSLSLPPEKSFSVCPCHPSA
jgi:hypothetical protein